MSVIASSVDPFWSRYWPFQKHSGVFQHFSSSTTLLKCQEGLKMLPPVTKGQRRTYLISSQPAACRRNINKIVCNSSPLPGLPDPSHYSWKGWMIGMLLSVIIPFWRHKWGPLLALKKEVDTLVDTVEAVVEVVEQMAEKVEEVADEIGDHLPKGKLKDALEIVEGIAKETAKDAHLADQLIEKAEAIEDKVEHFFESALEETAAKTKLDVGDHDVPNSQVDDIKKIQRFI